MIVITCLDQKNGMMFNHRRQSQDSVLREHVAILNAYMDRSIAEVRALVEQHPREITKDWEELNALFLAALEM